MITFATEASRRRFAEGLIKAEGAGLGGLSAASFAVEYVRAWLHLESVAERRDARSGGGSDDALPMRSMLRAPPAVDILNKQGGNP